MVEGVGRFGGVDFEVEVVAGLGVEDGHRHAVRLRLPEQRDLEPVAESVVQLACSLALHQCLLCSLHHSLSVPPCRRVGYAAHRRPRRRQAGVPGFGKANAARAG